MAVEAVAAVVLLAGNAFFVAVEFALARARPTMVEHMVEEGVAGAKAFKHGVDHIDNYLSACQLGITVCSIGLGITAEPLFTELLEGPIGESKLAGLALAFTVSYAIVSMLHVVLGELAPKSLAIARTRPTGLILMPPMRVIYIATRPLVDFLNYLGNLILRPFGVPPASEALAEPHSERELTELIAESQRRGLLDPEELQFAEGVFSFGDLRAREVMVPRTEVDLLTTDEDLRTATQRTAATGHRRMPLCEDPNGLDEPVGLINLTDLAAALANDSGDDGPELRDLARPLLEVPDTILLDDLLERLRDDRQSLALVRDEHGTAVGVIAMEDVIEQILGDIRDEFDPPREDAFERSGDAWKVAGATRTERVRAELEVELQESHAATIGGWITERVGRPPEEGEQVDIDGIGFEILEREGPGIASVLIRPKTAETDSGDPEPGSEG